jgi:hypothetical protein
MHLTSAIVEMGVNARHVRLEAETSSGASDSVIVQTPPEPVRVLVFRGTARCYLGERKGPEAANVVPVILWEPYPADLMWCPLRFEAVRPGNV